MAKSFIKQRRGVLPHVARLKGFPTMPRVPYSLQPPGGTSEDLFEQRYIAARAGRYPVITRPELRVMEWLFRHFGRDSQGVDWEYTVATLVSGAKSHGIQVDFHIYALGLLVWQVQGEYFHFSNAEQQATDLFERQMLAAAGYTVVNLLESQVNADVDRVCRSALNGEQLYRDPITSNGWDAFVSGAGVSRSA